MDDMWRRPFPSLFRRDRCLPIRPLSIRMPKTEEAKKTSIVVKID